MLAAHAVGLIVVGTNGLGSSQIFDCMDDLAAMAGTAAHGDDESKAKVIWGSLEVPKLQSLSQFSKKHHKDLSTNMAMALSLARLEQDPMNEVLNLWDSHNDSNLLLSLNLHRHQKQVSRAKLASALEQVSVKCVNAVGVDLNLLVSHAHMHILLTFIRGLGPRKARAAL
jgi:transcriptional accessory protein Tex/SPT6